MKSDFDAISISVFAVMNTVACPTLQMIKFVAHENEKDHSCSSG